MIMVISWVRRHRTVIGITALVAAGALALFLSLGWPGDGDDPGPAGEDAVEQRRNWVSDLPGLDLPQGAPLNVPFSSGIVAGDLIIYGERIPLEKPLRGFNVFPGGVIVAHGGVTGIELATRLDLVRTDGSVESIDQGIIAGASVARQPDGSLLLAYGWWDSPDASSQEIRRVDLATGVVLPALPAEPHDSVTRVSRETVVVARVYPEAVNNTLIDLETGTEIPAGRVEHSVDAFGTTAGGLLVFRSNERVCLWA